MRMRPHFGTGLGTIALRQLRGHFKNDFLCCLPSFYQSIRVSIETEKGVFNFRCLRQHVSDNALSKKIFVDTQLESSSVLLRKKKFLTHYYDFFVANMIAHIDLLCPTRMPNLNFEPLPLTFI